MATPAPGSALALLERAKSGDADAFGALAEEHREALLRLCMKMTGSHEQAEDLVQDTLLKAYLRIAEFELRSSLRTWLYRIATNACIDHLRAQKPWDLDKRWEWFRENGELVQQLEQTLYLSPERSAEVKEVAATCVNCVTMSLPEKQRAAITLCDQMGLSREEAANTIGSSVSSLKSELHRARKKMAEVYEHHCALVDENNECDGCLWAGRVKRRGAAKRSARASADAGAKPAAPADAPTTNDRAEDSTMCAHIDELLSDLIEGDLPDATRTSVETHVASCARCGPAYNSLKRTVRFIRAQSDVDLAPGTAGGNYYDFTSALMQGEPERAMETMGRWVLGWPAEGQAPATTKEGAGT